MYADVGENLYRGCAMDSAVTLEICSAQDQALSGPPLAHYRKMIELQTPFLYMELRGIRYDQDNAARMLAETKEAILPVGNRLCEAAGKELRGKLGSLSAPRFIETLYTEKGYAPQYAKEKGRKTERLTSDIEAILSLKRTDLTMNSSPISSNTAISKEFAKHCKSLLTATAECVAAIALKQRPAGLSAIRRLRVAVQICRPSRKISGSITLPIQVTISFSVTLKVPMAGPLPPRPPASATPPCGTTTSRA